jgi:hypothetical protein
MAQYPSTLFHFTDRESLYDILSSTFKVSYAREKILGGSNKKEFAVPMVSFSDLRLSELKDNIGSYGKFGIGLKKSWAIQNGLNPVMYVSNESFFTENFMDGIDDFFNITINYTDFSGKYEKAYNNTINTLRYMKNYSGTLTRSNGVTVKDFIFANEREWRYVPRISESILPFAPIGKIRTKKQKSEYNENASHIRLGFTPDDINYLIVENDSDINNLINHLRRVKNGFEPDIIDKLASRILTYEQINKDV